MVLGTTGGGTGAGFRLSDPHYARSFDQWDRALAALGINISASERLGIIQNNDQRYNSLELHHMQQSMWEVFLVQRTMVGQPGYYLDQVIPRMLAAGAIRRKSSANPQSMNPNDFEQVPSVRNREDDFQDDTTAFGANRAQALAKMQKQLRKFYKSQGLSDAEARQRAAQVAQLMIGPDNPGDDERRMALFADYQASLEDEAFLAALEQRAGHAGAFGSTLGAIIGGKNVVARTISSAFFETLAVNLFEVILNKGPIVALPSGGEVSVFDDFGPDFITNLKEAGDRRRLLLPDRQAGRSPGRGRLRRRSAEHSRRSRHRRHPHQHRRGRRQPVPGHRLARRAGDRGGLVPRQQARAGDPQLRIRRRPDRLGAGLGFVRL